MTRYSPSLTSPRWNQVPLSTRQSRRSVFRTDIQALRALAVGLVVLNHLWPNRITGGFVGVDVFFVISGFLITAHLTKEIIGTAKLSLARFYARRIKRLLPVAFLVLALGSVAVFLWVPYSEWERTAREVLMSVLYIENWSLAAQSVDYSALNGNATIAQHYWSLSVEEQFYFVWPLVLYGLYVLGKRFGMPRQVMAIGLGSITLASLAFSIYFTATNPNPAYFVTSGRVWEFAVGGLLALAATRISLTRTGATALATMGWAVILLAAMTFTQRTPFPGWTALLPVLGTVCVIASGTGRPTAPLGSLVGWRPIQFVGDTSYSIYLWHWPMIVVAPYLLGGAMTTWQKLGLALLCLPLAWLSKVLVEDTGKSWEVFGKTPRTTFVAMLVGILIVAIMSGGLTLGHKFKEAQAHELALKSEQLIQACYGPAAFPQREACPEALGPATVTVMGDANWYTVSDPACAEIPGRKAAGLFGVTECDFSEGKSNAKTAWITGDSHAQQWIPALIHIAKKNQWKLSYSLVGGCPVADVAFTGYRGSQDPAGADRCMATSQSIAQLIEFDKPDKIFYSNFSRQESVDDGSGNSQERQYTEGLPKFWQRWVDVGSTVYVLADPPLNGFVRDPNCVVLNPSEPLRCTVPRSIAHPTDPLVVAAEAMDEPKVKLIDLTDHFCDATTCYSVVGKVAVYFDPDHLNGKFSILLAPYIERKL